MKSIRLLKSIMIVFFLIQSLFSLFYESFFKEQNIFPFYTWKIFVNRPSKYLVRDTLSIHKIDDKIFNPPVTGLNFIGVYFPHIEIYNLYGKIHHLRGNNSMKRKTVENINALFLKEKFHVRWALVERKFNPIELFLKNKAIYQKEIEIFDAKK